MQYRQMSKSNSFSDWVNKKNSPEDLDKEESSSLLSQFSDIQNTFTSQMQEFSGSLPDAGPLSAAFRARMKYTIYLLLGSILFAVFAVFVGLPTIVLRPSKFALCLTLSTIFAVASVVVMQTPGVFLESLYNAGGYRVGSIVSLCLTSIATIYMTVFVRRYLVTLFAAGLQVVCILWFISSFIPGGSKGFSLLLKTCYMFVRTLLAPTMYVCTKAVQSALSSLLS
jgi:hypothetical protein